MSVTRERLRDDLRGWFRGNLHLDDATCILYSTDASLFQVVPLAVVEPLDEDDLAAIVQYAHENHLPIIPRGAGTGVAGESLGSGLILDLSVHFRRILEIGPDFIRTQAGVTLDRIRRDLAVHGRRLAVDPASPHCTIGGMIATNATGSRVHRLGSMRDLVRSLRVCWNDGSLAEIDHESTTLLDDILADIEPMTHSENDPPVIETRSGKDRTQSIVHAVHRLLRANSEVIEHDYPSVPIDRCGYQLREIISGTTINLARLLVGSEGTLGIVVEATLQTIPLPIGRSVVLFGFESLEGAIQAGLELRRLRPTICDLLDRRLLTLARQLASERLRQVPSESEAVLLVEFESEPVRDARDQAREAIEEIQERLSLSQFAVPALDEEAIAELWKIREMVLPSLYSLGQGARPLAFIEDIGIAPDQLLTFIPRVLDLLKRHAITASLLIHMHSGQIHLRPFLDLFSPADLSRLWPLAEEIYHQVFDVRGTISAQHGTGIARAPWIAKQLPRLMPVFRDLKSIFDPLGILNPGKIVSLDPSRQAWPLRLFPTVMLADVSTDGGPLDSPSVAPEEPPTSVKLPLLIWGDSSPVTEAVRCNGCGDCRTTAPGQRMCPMFHALPQEAASPRAKANLFRTLLSGTPEAAAELHSDRVREVADLCINCKMCATECPAQVNIPKLMIEARAMNQVVHGLNRADWVLARLEHFAALGSQLAPIVNILFGFRSVRWLLEKMIGISRRRRLPKFSRRNFLRQARRAGWTKKPEPGAKTIVYFVDVFANYNDPSIALATVAVLKHHGYTVYVPPEQLGCGMAPLAQGDIETAREVATHHLRLLADLAREGNEIICSEPTAALLFRKDYLDLIDDPDVALIARQTVELTTFLARLHAQGELRTDFHHLPITVGHHVPCHIKALQGPIAAPDLLRLIPGMQVHTIDVSCSGMAGSYGLKAENFERSLQMGEPMLAELRSPANSFGSTECSACRIQMEQGSGKRTLHPIQYLAIAYNLMPELKKRLRTSPRGLIS